MGIGGALAVLGLLAYLFLVIDGRELRGVLKQGGWAAGLFFVVLAILLVVVMSSHPEIATATHGGGHHG